MKDKIPFYNVVNMFFVGAVFSLCLIILLRAYLPFEWIKENAELLSDWSILISSVLLIAMFEFGFIINRMGSIFIGFIYQNLKWKRFQIWPKDDYGIDVSEIEQVNPRFQSMVTELVLMRSHIMMCFLLLILSLFLREWLWSGIFVFLIIVFTVGGRKHNTKINTIRRQFAQRKRKEKKQTQGIKDYFADD